MDFSLADSESPLPGVDAHSTVLTQMEQTAQEIHKSLNAILDYQTHHRLREAQGRKRGEDLNERVLWFSIIETSAILVIAISSGQLRFSRNHHFESSNDSSFFLVVVLRSFFSERKPSQMKYGRM